MSGPTLCGELSEWVGDGSLLNCCPEDPNEPFEDDFDMRRRIDAEGAWVDPNKGFLTEEEVAEHFGYYYTNEDGHPEVEEGDEEGDEDVVDVHVPSTTMSLGRPFVRRHTQFHHESCDYMERMLAGPQEPYEHFAAGSCTRIPLRRSTRYIRQ